MTESIQLLRDLMATAGKWPNELIVQGDADGSAYYECPACNGEGTIDAECVKQVHAGMVGVQVYGIGDQMEAMEQLIPLLIHTTPALLEVVEAAQRTLDLYEREWPQHKLWRERSPESQPIRDLLAALAKLEVAHG